MKQNNNVKPAGKFFIKKKQFLYSVPVFLGVAAVMAIGYSSLREDAKAPPSADPRATIAEPAAPALDTDSHLLIAYAPRQEPILDDALDPMLVQSILEEIVLDENQSAIINDQTRRQLDEAVFSLGFGEDRQSLDLLEQLIIAGLPEQVGLQAANIFRRYYEYKSAERELINSTSGSATQINQQLSALREGYLGHDLTERLFGEEQKYMRYALEVMALEQNPNLSASERQELQLRLQQEYYGGDELEGDSD